MIRLRSRKMFEADAGKRYAPPAMLDSGPGQRRVEIIAAVHEPCSGFDAVADAQCRLDITREYRSGEAVGTIVHQADRLIVIGHRHHTTNRAETFVGHYFHAVV